MSPDIIYNLNYALTVPGEAVISSDGRYRYTLTREWNKRGSKTINWLMCNPSIADANILDPTIKKCIKWSVLWGFDRLIVTNVFAYRSTDVKQIYKIDDPVGPDNDFYLEQTFGMCKDGLVVVAFGNNGNHLSRNLVVETLATIAGADLYCLRTTKYDLPEHPLYIPLNTELKLWRNNARIDDDQQSRRLGDTERII